KWFQNDGGLLSTVRRAFVKPFHAASWDLPTGDEIITILFTSNLIGVTFARSLHYQFYSWYAQQLPLLLWRTKYPLPIKLALLLGIEYSWNVFPSTNVSSYILDVSHALIIVGLWFGYPTGTRRKKVSFNDKVHELEDNEKVFFNDGVHEVDDNIDIPYSGRLSIYK
ncbi:dolichyl-P-Man:Man(5)GlcNAc(2)-PP-dolichol alpha-1,3-mannosyltransferase, partial [Serendipita sp. 399]